MVFFRLFILVAVLAIGSQTTMAQNRKSAYKLKRGQVFDIIFLTQKPGTDEQLKVYFRDVFPVASNMGYHNLKGFRLQKDPTQGNLSATTMVLGYWDSSNGRSEFLKQIEQQTPGFHKMRRGIWSVFGLTYYGLEQGLSFDVDLEKYNVVTAYWRNEKKGFKRFKEKWEKESTASGGKLKLALEGGKSPFGYHYQPDYLSITEWESKAAFEAFHKTNLKMGHHAVKHVNQFVIQQN